MDLGNSVSQKQLHGQLIWAFIFHILKNKFSHYVAEIWHANILMHVYFAFAFTIYAVSNA